MGAIKKGNREMAIKSKQDYCTEGFNAGWGHLHSLLRATGISGGDSVGVWHDLQCVLVRHICQMEGQTQELASVTSQFGLKQMTAPLHLSFCFHLCKING